MSMEAGEPILVEDILRGITIRNGVPLLPRLPGAKPVTKEHVKEIQDLLDREDAMRAYGLEPEDK